VPVFECQCGMITSVSRLNQHTHCLHCGGRRFVYIWRFSGEAGQRGQVPAKAPPDEPGATNEQPAWESDTEEFPRQPPSHDSTPTGTVSPPDFVFPS